MDYIRKPFTRNMTINYFKMNDYTIQSSLLVKSYSERIYTTYIALFVEKPQIRSEEGATVYVKHLKPYKRCH